MSPCPQDAHCPQCPHCNGALETPLACSTCGALLSVAPETPPHLILDMELAWACADDDLQRNHRRFSRMVHPDFYATAAPAERELAEHNSALLNSAYDILADDLTRAEWLLEHLGGPTDKEERQMPQEFLMEVMDWNETLAAHACGQSSDEDLDSLRRDLHARRAAVAADLGRHLDPLPEPGAPALLEVRRLLNAARYIERSLEHAAADQA
ncbi:MAG: iron-sulfur cluster co-chaperone HscB C-terminal domain-containing protein [Planctomycetota bacterium]|nr:hypothetical protein [Planctomycetota bacterium]MDP6518762.1 iron-sulfur cluster co-chaperone HscB C-terminal domain-containing protein [Planctomycetota bacterium]MDP6838218.1 iron-sulfur cluster co-chaperone HscB C-terminal domain-containing protein [Planctomycetota bacterium]MDP6956789.1 iron-sulfur cluster co-chaperone HscB C-terminal domain-containing protein [Planctomycetota bacterium]